MMKGISLQDQKRKYIGNYAEDILFSLNAKYFSFSGAESYASLMCYKR